MVLYLPRGGCIDRMGLVGFWYRVGGVGKEGW